MKKFLLKMLATLASCAVIYVGVIFAFHSIGKANWLPNVKVGVGGFGYTLLRLKEAETVENIDMLFIGSSQVYRGFDPRIFGHHGIKTFNLGSSAQTPFSSYYLLKEHLPHMKPKYVVLDLFWPMLSNDPVEAGVDIISSSEVKGEVIEMTWHSREVVLYNSLLVNWISQMASPLDTTRQRRFENDVYVKGGFTQSRLVSNRASSEELASLSKKRFTPNPLQLEYLNKIVELCKVQGAELILTVAPVTKEYQQSVPNYDEFTSLVSEVADRNRLLFLDYNKETDLVMSSSKDFIDKNHLSQAGVEKFNRRFIKDLKGYRLLDAR